MQYLVFDIETDGLLDTMTTIHSLVIKDSEGEVVSCHTGSPKTIEAGIQLLKDANRQGIYLMGHNIIDFDLPALLKVYPKFTFNPDYIVDTLVVSRLVYPHLTDLDGKLIKKKKLPSRLRGSHSLEAWGYRLGLHKGDYKKEMQEQGIDPWAAWNRAMQDYCENDVEVNDLLWKKLQARNVPDQALKLETWFAYIIQKQEQFGYAFDKKKAVTLYQTLYMRRDEIDTELLEIFKPRYVNRGLFTPRVDNKKNGYTKGVTLCKVELQPFNPGSRQQIASRLMKEYGWKPKVMTNGGQPQVDEGILSKLPYPPCKLLAERFLVEKRIGQLAEGQNAWLKLEKDGRIHGRVNTIGAVTGRCTHSRPNVAQVPGIYSPYGKECRELFHVPGGFVQVGADASGLELRCLAHYMGKYDGGAYAKIILEGDIHTANQQAAGLAERNQAKTFIYAFLYGAGDEKIGSIVGKGARAGKKLKEQFLNKTPALKRLREDVLSTVKQKGSLRGIDGRTLHIRSQHSALNTLLQSAGALLVKQATINLYQELTRRGFQWGADWAMVAHVHDEYQLQVREGIQEEISEVAVWSFREAGKQFNWRCPLDGEAKTGRDWSECH